MTLVLNRRQMLAGSSAALALGILGTGRANAATHMRFLWWGSKERADRTFKAVKAYEKANSGVTIEGESFGWDNYWTRLATQTAGGNSPDLIQMDYRYIFEYARRGVLLDFNPYVGKSLKISDFGQQNIDSGKVEDKLYGVSLGVNSSAVMVNLAAWKEAGLEPPADNIDWDSFAELCAKFTKQTKRHDYYGAADESGLEPALEGWLRQRGKALYKPDGSPGFEGKDIADWFDYWAKLRKMKACVPPEMQALDQLTVQTAMISQNKASISFAHSNQFVAFQGINKDKLGMIPYPVPAKDGKPGQYLKPSMLMSVSASSKNKDAAVAFVNYLVENPDAAKILGVERGVPASEAMRKELTPTLDALGKQMADYIQKLTPKVGPLPPPPPNGAGENSFLLQKVSQEVAFGKMSSEEGGKSYSEKAAANIKRG